MAALTRYPLQGVVTVVRFNWHLFAIAALATTALLAVSAYLPPWLAVPAAAGAFAILLSAGVSLLATFWAYDLRGFYRFDWLAPYLTGASDAANIHSGFDESSPLLIERYPRLHLEVFDFYDSSKHTEVSIRRARKSVPPRPGTVSISTGHIPAPDQKFDAVVLILAAHEIRDPLERIAFFREVRRVLKPTGRVVMAEHLRDAANILAYNIGAWHFHSASAWREAVTAAGLRIAATNRLNWFISCLVLRIDESSP